MSKSSAVSKVFALTSPRDLEGHIVRCQERIEEGIMPYIFENRLKHLEEVKRETLYVIASHSILFMLTRFPTQRD